MANELDAFRGQLSPEILDALERELSSDDILDLGKPRTSVVYRPGATGAAAEQPNVFTTWGEAYNAIEQLRGAGRIFLECDSRYSSTTVDYSFALFGGVVPSAQIPAGTWDMTEVVLTNPMSIGANTTVDLLEGCVLSGLEYIEPHNMNINYDGTTPGAILTRGLDILFEFMRFTNTNPGAAAIFDASLIGNIQIYDMGGAATFFGWATVPFPGGENAAPIFDCNGARIQLNLYGGGQVENGAFKDTAGGGQIRVRTITAAGAGIFSPFQFDLPTTTVQHQVWQGDAAKIGNSSPPASDPYNWVIQATGAIALPSALNYSGGRVYVKDWTFAAGTTPVDITAPEGQTIDRKVKVNYDNLLGGTFTPGDTVTFGGGSTGTVLADDGVSSMTCRITVGDAVPLNDETMDNGGGVTADVNGNPAGFDQLTADGECQLYRTDTAGNWIRC